MNLFEVKITAHKIFYVEAETRDDALANEAVENERACVSGEFDWEVGELQTCALDDKTEDRVRQKQPGLIIEAQEK